MTSFGGRYGPTALGPDGSPLTMVAAIALGLGLTLSLAASLLLACSTWHARGKPTRALLVPFLAAFTPLVVFSLATPFAPDGSYSTGFQQMLFLSYAGVLLWIGVALWVLLHDDQNIRFLPQSFTGPRKQLRNQMSQTHFRA